MPRLAVLRLRSLTQPVVKEPKEPCIFILNLDEPLTDTQTRRLAIAAPWSPVMIVATLGALPLLEATQNQTFFYWLLLKKASRANLCGIL
jgi:hypothetical protein